MDSREGLIALRDRVGKLTGEAGIDAVEVNFLVEAWRLGAEVERWPMAGSDFRLVKDGKVLAYRAPEYVFSVDAVLSLIGKVKPAPQWGWGVGCSTALAGPFVAELRRTGIIEPTDEYYFGATPALALLHALLSALPPGDTSNG